MDEFFEKVTSQQDPFKKLASHIPGFSGYIERQNRRDADKLLRDTVARRFEEQWKRASQLQMRHGQQRHDPVRGRHGEGCPATAHLHRQDQHRPARLFRLVRRRQDQRKGTRSDLPVRLPRSSISPTRSGAPSITWKPASAMKPHCPPPSATSHPWPGLAVETYNRRI